jgi:predicted outer membrane protein
MVSASLPTLRAQARSLIETSATFEDRAMSRHRETQAHGLVRRALSAALCAGAIACSTDKPPTKTASAAPGRDSAAKRVVSESHGEVTPAGDADARGWLSDENILALGRQLNNAQMGAANVELEHWHTSAVRGLAEQMKHDHAAMQTSLDSLAAQLKIAPVTPALATVMDSSLRREIDGIAGLEPGPLEQAYIRQQMASHERMIDELRQLAAAADRPELSALLSDHAARLQLHLSSVKSLQGTLVADSVRVADSTRTADSTRAARRRARHE